MLTPVTGMAGKAGGAFLASALLAGCLAPEKEMQARFAVADHSAWMGKGTSAIDGEGFLRRPNGWLARCSGGHVLLLPQSAYFREWVEIYRSGARVQNASLANAAHREAVRQTQCDMNGRFDFRDLPAGKWFVVLRVNYEGQAWQADQTLLAGVETKVGEVAKVILSNPNRI